MIKKYSFFTIRLLFLFAIFSVLVGNIYCFTPNSISVEVVSPEHNDIYQLFYDTGKKINEKDSVKHSIMKNDNNVEINFFPVPGKLETIRIDPGTHEGYIIIKSIVIGHEFHRLNFNIKLYKLPLEGFLPVKNISEFTITEDMSLYIKSTGDDPYFIYSGELSCIYNKLYILKCFFYFVSLAFYNFYVLPF